MCKHKNGLEVKSKTKICKMGGRKYTSAIKIKQGTDERLYNLVINYENRDTITFLRGKAQNFTF